MVCHEALGPSRHCWLGWAACRTLAIRVGLVVLHGRCEWPATRSPSTHTIMILALYRPAVGGDSRRSARSTVETRFSELASESDRPGANAVVRWPAFWGAHPCTFYRSQAASASSPVSRPLASAMRAAARPLLAHAETGLQFASGSPLRHNWPLAVILSPRF